MSKEFEVQGVRSFLHFCTTFDFNVIFVSEYNTYLQNSLELIKFMYFVNFELYIGCPGENVPDFGRMFLKLKYTDITKNTCIRSWTVTDIMAREKCGLLAVLRTVPGSRDVLPVHCACLSTFDSSAFMLRLHMQSAWNPKDNYDISASVYVV